MRKKRSATLIEMVIVLALLSFLLSSLFIWHYQVVKTREDLKGIKWTLMEERYAHQRLERIFSKTVKDENQNHTTFFSSDQNNTSGIIFTFDHGPQREPLLSSLVLARLYLDTNENCLCLGIWPLPKKEEPPLTYPSHTVILLDNVSKLEFGFYHPPDPFEGPVAPEEITKTHPKKGWQTSWLESYVELPTLIKIFIERGADRKIELVYDLSNQIIVPKI